MTCTSFFALVRASDWAWAIVATLGPCICGDCYEVGGDIADEFDAQFPGTFTLSRFGEAIVATRESLQEITKRAGMINTNIQGMLYAQ